MPLTNEKTCRKGGVKVTIDIYTILGLALHTIARLLCRKRAAILRCLSNTDGVGGLRLKPEAFVWFCGTDRDSAAESAVREKGV